jgi:hypothetical protein
MKPRSTEPMTKNERGQALFATIVGISLILLLLLTALTITQNSGAILAKQLIYQGQALNAAQAGLTEGLSWFRRQTVQPVATFAPIRDLTATPPLDDTETQSIGLVRNYLISGPGRIWGRYELQKTGYTPATNTIDITAQRGKKGVGIVWQLESIGTVYVNNDPTKAYNVSPNAVLARATLRSEIQRLGINLPANAALCVSRSDRVNLQNNNVRIIGESKGGMAWVNSPSGGVPIGSGYSSTVSGTPATSSGITAAPDKFTIPMIFGVTLQELLGMADLVYTDLATLGADYPTIDPATGLPQSLPPMTLIVLNNPGGNFTFTQTQPLNGTGILVVLGNLTMAANSASVFNGLIYVQGTYTQLQPSSVNGSVIVDDATPAPAAGVRTVIMSGAGERPQIKYDVGLLNYVARRMGLYSTTRTPYIPCVAGQICN